MKIITTFLLLGLTQITMLFPQVGVLQPDEYKYYIRTTNNEIRDARDFKIVYNQFPDGETRLSTDKKYLLVHNAGNIYCMNTSGKLIAKTNIPANANLSPTWDKILFTENGDLWTSDVNCKTGKIDNKQKITELGIFGSNIVFNLISWFDDIITLPMDNWVSENLRIDLKKKSVEALYITQETNYSRISGSPSPNGRFLVHTGVWNGANISINDLQNNKVTKTDIYSSDKGQHHVWINNNQFFFEGKMKSGDWFIFDLIELKIIKNFSNINAFTRITDEPGASSSSCVSLNGTYIVMHKYSTIDDTQGDFLIVNIKNTKTIQAAVGSHAKHYAWLTDDKLIYSEFGSINRQGTWILNAVNGEIKKVSSFQSSGFVTLPEVNQVLFSANNIIWRVNHDGTNLVQLTNSPQNYFGLKGFINFPDLELKGDIVNAGNTQNSGQKPVVSTTTKGYVKTKQGSNLRLRSEPSDKSTILTQIPNSSQVKILREDNKEVIVNGEKGKWLKIEYEGIIGWAWGNFIVKQ